MPRACLPQNFRPSDVIRISANGKGRTGKRAVVVERENFDVTVKVFYRGIVKGSSGEHISQTVEAFTSLPNTILFPVEGVWEGELVPGAPGRTVEYNNRAYEAPKPRAKRSQKGEAKVPTKGKTKPAAKRKPAAKQAAATPRATEAQLDKQAAQVVKMRDTQNKSWADIEAATGIAASRLRQLYNRGGGSPNATKATGGGRKAAKPAPKASTRGGKTGAKGRKGRNPS